MKQLLVLGAGTAGTRAINRLCRSLDPDKWKISVVDPVATHYYQPGFLFIPFGVYGREDVVAPKRRFIPPGVEMISATAEAVEPDRDRVKLADGRTVDYDFLVIATGANTNPQETPGLDGPEWYRSIYDFYTFEGAVALAERLRTWQGGRLVLDVVENPIKCPVAPLEFMMLADWYFRRRGIRDRVELVYVTPVSSVFATPIASRYLSEIMKRKGIEVVTDFMVEHVEPDTRKLVEYDESELGYDLLVTVPLHKGDEVVGRSGLGDELNYVEVDKHTLLSKAYPNIFALGDAAGVPTSKSGATAHFEVDCFSENFPRYVDGRGMHLAYDGHTNCFIESGFGKALLIDFNYDVEPLPGCYPLPRIGPFALLQESRLNHWGKMMFRWIYWNILLNGRVLPLPANMSMSGKVADMRETVYAKE